MKIIIVGQDFEMLNILESTVKSEYHNAEISVFTDMVSAKESAIIKAPDIAFVNIDQEGGKGKALIEKIQELNPKANIIMISECSNYSVDLVKLYPSGYIVKPVTSQKIIDELHNLRFPIKKMGFKSLFV